MNPTPSEPRSAAWAVLPGLFLLLLMITAYLVILSFPAGVYTVFFTHLSNETSARSLGSPILFLGPVLVVLPFSVSLGGIFLAMTGVYIAMFVLALSQGKGAVSAIRSALQGGVGEYFTNRALLTLISIGFLIYTAAIIDSFVSAAGSPVGDPFTQVDPLQVLLGFTLAPLREEFGFRVLLIGLVVSIVSLGLPDKVSLKALWRPSAAYEGVDNNTAMIAVVWIAGAASSGIFGACHVGIPGLCGGGGWNIGKFPEAAYGGVVLGYLYIKYGFHVAVLAHWGVDYLSSVFAFFGQGAYGIPWLSNPGYSPQQLVAVDIFGLFGLASLLVVLYVGAVRLFKRGTDTMPGPS